MRSVLTNREGSIELLRIVLMFGICLLHSITQAGHCIRGLDNVLHSCVDGFVFISGYYGIRYRMSKVLSLLGVSLYAAFFAYGFSDLVYGTYSIGWQSYVWGFWFVWAYIALMLFTPLINAALEERACKEMIGIVLPVLFMVFVWSYACMIPGVKNCLPVPIGFGSHSYTTLLGIYLFARFIRLGKLEDQLSTRVLLLLIVVLIGMAWVGLGQYNSPVALLLSASTFLVFKRIHLPEWLARLSIYLAPSMFAVYVLHANGAGYRSFRLIQTFLIDEHGVPHVIGWLVAAFVVFVVCVAIDCLRRQVVTSVKKMLKLE